MLGVALFVTVSQHSLGTVRLNGSTIVFGLVLMLMHRATVDTQQFLFVLQCGGGLMGGQWRSFSVKRLEGGTLLS